LITLDANSAAGGAILRTDPCGALYKLAAAYPGKTLAIRIGRSQILVFQDADAAQHILRTRPENYHKNFGSFVAFFGHSRLTEDGERWRMLQKLSQPMITAVNSEAVATATNKAFGTIVDRLLSVPDSPGGIAIDPYLDTAAAAVISNVVLGFGMEELGKTTFDDFRAILRECASTTWNFAGAVTPANPELAQTARSSIKRLSAAISDLVKQRRSSASTPNGLLDILVSTEPGKVDLLGEICTLLFAGFDTSAAALGWSLWLLATKPAAQAKLRSRILAVMGRQQYVAVEHLTQLPDLLAFINEALRLFPPIPILSRIAQDPDTINEHLIPAGQRVLISVIGLHYDGRFFSKPMNLVLDRFPNGQPTREQLQHFIPFGTGPRVCGGSKFAMVELPLALMILLRSLHFSHAPNSNLQFEWGASLRRKGGHRFLIRRAQNEASAMVRSH
jgi:enediyne biosynthesis protein E7